MTAVAQPAEAAAEVRQIRGPVAQFWARLRRKRLAMLSLAVILVIYGAGISASVIAPYSYSETNLDRALEGPSAQHWFGTDRLGRDMFSRTVYSARTTLIVSVAVLVSGGLIIGNGLGLLAGYRGGWVDNVVMRVGEVLSALPGLPMLILVNAALGPRIAAWLQAHESIAFLRPFASYLTVFSVLSLFFWVGTARIVRSQVLQVRERDFVTAARALGGSTAHIIWVHLVPNIAFLLVLQLSATLGSVAGSEIALTWFGVGVQPPTPSFGAMIYEGSGARNFQTHPHLLLVPGMCVSALLFAFALLGDAINDVIRQR